MAVREKDWRELLDYLRDRFPTRHRLVVRRVDMPSGGRYGQASDTRVPHVGQTDHQITVTIDKSRPYDDQVHTLLHEMAHALEYDQWDDHGKRWGELYSKVYLAWEQWEKSDG